MLSLKFTLETKEQTASLIFSLSAGKPVLWGKVHEFLRQPVYLSETLFDSSFNRDVSLSFLPLGEKGLKNLSFLCFRWAKETKPDTLLLTEWGIKLCMCTKQNEKCLLFSAG